MVQRWLSTAVNCFCFSDFQCHNLPFICFTTSLMRGHCLSDGRSLPHHLIDGGTSPLGNLPHSHTHVGSSHMGSSMPHDVQHGLFQCVTLRREPGAELPTQLPKMGTQPLQAPQPQFQSTLEQQQPTLLPTKTQQLPSPLSQEQSSGTCCPKLPTDLPMQLNRHKEMGRQSLSMEPSTGEPM